jgi:hypothetical protein
VVDLDHGEVFHPPVLAASAGGGVVEVGRRGGRSDGRGAGASRGRYFEETMWAETTRDRAGQGDEQREAGPRGHYMCGR